MSIVAMCSSSIKKGAAVDIGRDAFSSPQVRSHRGITKREEIVGDELRN
jgi:hypothetical protein